MVPGSSGAWRLKARPPATTTITATQREYLDFIVDYIALHKMAPAQADMQAFFKVSPPSVHRVVVVLTEKGLIQREPGKARSIQVTEAGMEVLCDGTYPSRPGGLITAPLDAEIAPLVHALQADRRVVTRGSCSGHGEKTAYIDLAVDGVEGMRVFVKRLRAAERGVKREAFFEVSLNWRADVLTACAFDIFPNWIMLSWTIEGRGRNGAPSAEVLAKIVEKYRAGT